MKKWILAAGIAIPAGLLAAGGGQDAQKVEPTKAPSELKKIEEGVDKDAKTVGALDRLWLQALLRYVYAARTLSAHLVFS